MNPNSPNNTPLWLCLHFGDLPLEVFTRGLADGDSQPVVVIERHRICRLNQAARDLGIEVGNNMDTAYTLSEQVTGFERDESREYRHLSHLAQWAYRFTPDIVARAPSCLVMDITASLKLFGGFESLSEQIVKGVAQLGYRPVMGTGSTPLEAELAARAGLPLQSGSFQDLPVTCLSIEPNIIDALQQMGIADIGSLLALPRGGLARRFGVFFVDYLQRLTGEKPDPQKFIQPKPVFASEIVFLADVTDTQALVFPIKRLLSELCDFLEQRQLSTGQLSWKLAHRSHSPREFSIYLANPEHDPAVFMPLTQLKLDQIRDVREIDSISLVVKQFVAADKASGDLFHGTRFQQKTGLMDAGANQLLNLLNTRLGPGTCYGLEEANDHRPEKAWRSTRVDGKAPSRPDLPVDTENPRPVFLLETPRPLQVVAGRPCLGGRLELLKGPERIDFGWWDETNIARPIARDYYTARQDSGALFWIFNYVHDPRGWYLHGIFS